MNIKLISSAVRVFTSIAPSIKGWIFSDGKFVLSRAVTLLATLLVLILAAALLGTENLEPLTEALDSVSDIIGYAE